MGSDNFEWKRNLRGASVQGVNTKSDIGGGIERERKISSVAKLGTASHFTDHAKKPRPEGHEGRLKAIVVDATLKDTRTQ